jgi:RNA polymerase sigma-54 factor
MEIRQRTELRKLLVPELAQSLNILSLPLPDLKALIETESENNPFLDESETPQDKTKISLKSLLPPASRVTGPDTDFVLESLTQKPSLQDVLLRQLGMFTESDEEFSIGQEIIGNIDENGYLQASLEEIAATLNITQDKVENALKLIQQFEPSGVAARTVSECLLIQLESANEKDPLLKKLAESHLEDIAKKNYHLISKALKEPFEKIELLIKKILKLDPKPGRNYSRQETQRIIPDIIISEKDEGLEIAINDEDIPTLKINEDYRAMLKDNSLNPQTKEFLTAKLNSALEILRAISKRKFTLRKIVETIVEIQQEAILSADLSSLKPLTFKEVAQKIEMHESTVCRAVMNKYVELPYQTIALRNLFSSRVHDTNGQSVSSTHIKVQIKELIDQEDKKHPLSDGDIVKILLEKNNLKVARRTVAKYREELKILSSTYRKER